MASRRQPTAERRRQIAEAALRIIGYKGIRRLTAAEIGREVGIADATVFRHFRNKHEIVLAAIDRLHELLFEGFPPDEADPIERLKSFFMDRLAMSRARPELVQFTLNYRLAEAAGVEGLTKAFAVMERQAGFVESCIAEAQAQGLIHQAFAVRPLALIFLSSLHATAYAQFKSCSRIPVDPQTVWDTMELLLRGAAIPAAARRRHTTG
ncbi:MAG TPA: TetR/AcrR family transcriptional regulator [Myxococcales bacterium]|jgi:AcrR family transcriptional regulator|nr:TetR/AcrR family transcriptional regulator [Myxococcales bacterium]